MARFLLVFVLFLGAISAFPLVPRANKMHPSGGVALIRWSSTSGSTAYLRNYHIDKDGNIIESSFNPGSTSWVSGSLSFKARASGPMKAAVRKLSSNDFDVEIRIFFQAQDSGLLRSLRYTPQLGWHNDNSFNQLNIDGEACSVITWPGANGIQYWRVYYAKKIRVHGDYRDFHLYEAAYSDSPGSTWSKDKFLVTTSIDNNNEARPAATASVWLGGSRISLLYWDAQMTEAILEYRWSSTAGWRLTPVKATDGLRNRYKTMSLASVAWVDAADTTQLRLYVRCQGALGRSSPRLLELMADGSGWSTQYYEFPTYAIEGATGGTPVSAVVWTDPGADNAHMRLHYPRCAGGLSEDCDAVVREIGYDTGLGWRSGALIDG